MTVAGKEVVAGAVADAHLPELHEAEVIVDEGVDGHELQLARILSLVFPHLGPLLCIFHHGRAHGAAVVQRTRVDYLLHLRILDGLLGCIALLEEGVGHPQHTHCLLAIVIVAMIAGCLGGRLQGLIGDAPLVGTDAEGTALQGHALGQRNQLRLVGHILAVLIHQGGGQLGIDIGKDALQVGLHLVGRQLAIGHFVFGFEQVERSGGIVHLILVLRVVIASREGRHGEAHA